MSEPDERDTKHESNAGVPPPEDRPAETPRAESSLSGATPPEPAPSKAPDPEPAAFEKPPREPVLIEAQAHEAQPPDAPPRTARRRPSWLAGLTERPEVAVLVPRHRLAAQSRRDFLIFAAGIVATAAGAWWLLPDRTKSRLAPGRARDFLDSFAARVGLTRDRRERALGRTLTFDDDVAEALYSKDRSVRTYGRSDLTPLRNNYDGQTPGPEYLATWTLNVSGLASGRMERFTIDQLLRRFPLHEQITRLVCVEGWSAVAWWGGIRFADFLAAFPPAPGARWAAMRSAVNLDTYGRSDPYYVSIDLETARHPQTLLATHQGGRPLTLAHGAPLRLLAPMKLGLKNIKAVTDIAYGANEPSDYWNERGYSRYDGL